jgi:type I restriction enzyme R subunit
MVTVAKRLIEDPYFSNPTVLMIVDRNELEQQLFGNLEAVGFGRVEIARSKRHLIELLRSDYRGLIVSMIHKFEGIPANVNTRENIFVLIDEAHRSTGGKLGNYLMGALPNATYIGFTGTPIDKTAHGKGTFKVFGADDPKGYLDKYSIKESIEDGTTVPLHYSLAPNELQVDKETLEKEFLNLKEIEGVSDIEELNKVLDKAVTLKNMLKSPDRVEKISKFVAEHFRETVEPMGYKAFLVAVDREACAFYKEALDKYLPPEYSEVVISRGPNDPEELVKYHRTEEQEEQIRKNFRNPDALPKILIVTEKLLTGFDAPILYCMYLDKPMCDHVLLQAIARVNRPYEDDKGRRKPAGFVLDFVGIFDNLEKALAFDSEDVKGVIEGIDVLKERFVALIEDGRKIYLPLVDGKDADKAAEAVLEYFRDREIRQGFYQYFQELQDVYEILSPDPFLRPYMKDYEELTRIYFVLRANYESGIPIDRDFLRKTARLVQEKTEAGVIQEPTNLYKLDEEAFKKIVNGDEPDIVKVFNLLKAIRNLVDTEGQNFPYLIPIGERAEQIAKSFEERQITTQEALKQSKNTTQEIFDADKEKKKSNLSTEEFAIYWFLKREGIANAENIARQAADAFTQYPHWQTSKDQELSLRRQLIKVLLSSGVQQVLDFTERIMKMLERRFD